MPTLDTIHDYLAAHSDEAGQCILFASTAIANQPHLVRDVQQKKKILDVLESATRGCDAWKLSSIAFPSNRSAPCWPSCKLLPSMKSPTCPPWSR